MTAILLPQGSQRSRRMLRQHPTHPSAGTSSRGLRDTDAVPDCACRPAFGEDDLEVLNGSSSFSFRMKTFRHSVSGSPNGNSPTSADYAAAGSRTATATSSAN